VRRAVFGSCVINIFPTLQSHDADPCPLTSLYRPPLLPLGSADIRLSCHFLSLPGPTASACCGSQHDPSTPTETDR
jgi:hypothetical protein